MYVDPSATIARNLSQAICGIGQRKLDPPTAQQQDVDAGYRPQMPLWAAERSGASPKGVNPQKDG